MIQLQSGEPKGSLLAYLHQDVYDIARGLGTFAER